MPELPEVETLRRELAELLKEKPVIEGFEFRRKDLRDPMPITKIKQLIGQSIRAVSRRAKYLLFETDKGFLLSHLGMTGSWRPAGEGDERDHDHVVIRFTSGLRLIFRDPRRFGVLDFTADPGLHKKLKSLGPEPLEPAFTGEILWLAARRRKLPLKTFVMHPEVVVGVGNIYASEALFRAGLKPTKRADRVSRIDFDRLAQTIRQVLTEAIEAGGSSISDFVHAGGESGSFQTRFRVYDRAGEPCLQCGQKIRRQVQSGRSTYSCPKCQK